MLVHKATERTYKKYLKHKPHALLFVGGNGSGKVRLAQQLAQEVLNVTKLENYAYFTGIDAKEEGIDAVRNLQNFFSKKTTGQAEIRRIAMLTNSESLSSSAQNALLKTIEEPPADSMLLITATDPTRLLTTILSRVQKLSILPLELQQVLSNTELNHYDQNKLVKAFHMSGGQAQLMHDILQNDEHELVTELLEAKQIVGSSTFERLAMIETIIKSKRDIGLLLRSLQRVLDSGFYLAVSKNHKQAKKLHKSRKAVDRAQSQLSHSVNTKLLLTNLFLNI